MSYEMSILIVFIASGLGGFLIGYHFGSSSIEDSE